MNSFEITANLVDILQGEIYPAEIQVQNGRIHKITRLEQPCDTYIMPGFTDAHVHVESSMLIPSEFARLAVVHGTVATISDPHEIANVMGVPGVEYMLNNGKQVPFKFNFGAPSCVPATTFETAGATVTAADVAQLLKRDDIKYLTEMMNFPGVLHHDPEVIAKIAAAKALNKPVDGHAPGLRGEDARKYINAGISTDHECFTEEEAAEKLSYGMHILIREGSAAKNFEALIPLLPEHYEKMMFCSDDKHPDNLEEGHINQLVKRALAKGIDLFKVLRVACVNPVLHYQLDNGLLREGDAADFITVDNLQDFNILGTWINGNKVAENGKTLIPSIAAEAVNNFSCNPKSVADFRIECKDQEKNVQVIGAIEGELITNKLEATLRSVDNNLVSDTHQDVLKLTVVNRYRESAPALGFIKGFGLKAGAIASSVAHDSHNIIAVGTDDESICAAVNAVIAAKGGVSIVSNGVTDILPLPVAGLMSNLDGYTIAAKYSALDKAAKAAGSTLASPFMTLSFMALLVIPHLKLSDLGLFDGDTFTFTAI
ncbi:adenine deaminase [Chitinophaga dinghuensis]|uniref:Adenine deaminase n=1 Tax=Chitinophaga dinghuensis TaxID=1539050 RepID=A0A327W5Z0_9BACT|nr:adenine deaminase [Chitinophaga dinghuensis]RAJ85917.1 adenine deaminase [Chitinophaga dinghuensis]